MPSRNIVKVYVENSYYHIYNRGIEKRVIFEDDQDYKVFLKYLKESLSKPPDPNTLAKSFTLQGATFKGVPRIVKNFFTKVELLAYCLMPNHFHLLIKQSDKNCIKQFMQSIMTRYSMYFNKKYDRVGKLFQGHYKAALVTTDDYLLHLSRYIHLNPSEYIKNIEEAYSSYAEYLGKRKTDWIKTDEILSYFKKTGKDFLGEGETYKDFVEKYKIDSAKILEDITLE